MSTYLVFIVRDHIVNEDNILYPAAVEGGWMVLCPFAAVSGTTALTMVFDRDIDARMAGTAERSLPSGTLSPG
jgi:heme O synthase-like polyprenyltransferase